MITLYSNGCPACIALENILRKRNIEFKVVNEMAKILEVSAEHNISQVPFGEFDGNVYTATELMGAINEGKIT